MNPMPMVLVLLRDRWGINLALVLFIALATGLGIAILSQERALMRGSAKAVDKFDLIVGAPGSTTDLTLKALFLRPGTVDLLGKAVVADALADRRAEFVAPLGFGDSVAGAPVVGTTPDLVMHLANGRLAEGKMFETWEQAVVGHASPLKVGERFRTTHGHGEEADADADGDHEHPAGITVTGRLPPTGSPWDRAVIIPIEQIWVEHGLTSGHMPDRGEAIGPPFDRDFVPAVPALVIKPGTLSAAYGLRNHYRGPLSTAFFPAEVLVELYRLLGDIRVLVSAIALGSGLLVIAASITTVMMLINLNLSQFAILRVLGAPRRYVFVVVWLYASAIMALGALLGLALGWLGALLASRYVADETGIALEATIGTSEIGLALAVLVLGALASLVPAYRLMRERLDQALLRR